MNLLVTGASRFSNEQLDTLRKSYDVYFMQSETDSIPLEYDEIDAVICNGLFLHHPIEKFTSLKTIQLTSAGYDRAPMDYINKNNITIYNARGVYSIPIAEYVLCSVLEIYKNKRTFYKNQENHIWGKIREIRELFGKNVLILGCGSIGDECAKRFNAFGCCVNGIDVRQNEKEFYEKIYSVDKLGELLPTADVIVVALPLCDETRGIIDKEKISLIKKDACFVNISRGETVENDVLKKALREKQFFAVLDVFPKEPLDENDELWDMENVIITPHNSFVGEENTKRLFDIVIKNLEIKK